MNHATQSTLTGTPVYHRKWLQGPLSAINSDFNQRVIEYPEHACWRSTDHPNLQIRVLEFVPGSAPQISDRLTAQLRLTEATDTVLPVALHNLELLILQGELEDGHNAYPEGIYLRYPQTPETQQPGDEIPLNPGPVIQASGLPSSSELNAASSLIHLSAGHIAATDTEWRCINTLDESRWLPGPVENIDVMALHGHGTSNAMLLRWHEAVTFQPRLDPLGEEILVLEGCLQDSDGNYGSGTWIRNPVSAWHPWTATAGTLVYYKSGHFAATPETADAAQP